VKEVVGGAGRSREELLRAINRIPQLSMMFVDQARLGALAQEMRTVVESLR